MKITAAEARAYFSHPSQQIEGLTPDKIPEQGVEYYAEGPVCGAFHAAPWPGVFFAHYGVFPSGWGRLKEPALSVLNEAWADLGAVRLIGWTRSSNRAAIAFAKRLNFSVDGEMPIRDDTIIMTGWTPWH